MQKKKIGIITFHKSVNYGAIMQTFALQKFLINNNYDVEIIDYINDKIENELNEKISIDKVTIKGYLKKFLKIIYRKRKRNQFNRFIKKEINLTMLKNIKNNDIKKIANDYDVVITGSDQVWNLKLTDNDFNYFLDFLNDNVKKIGYAVSVGDDEKIDLTPALHKINKFNFVSTREKSFKDYSFKKYGLDFELCCDPTLLLNKDEYYNFTKKSFIKRKYIFCFLMENKPTVMEVANKLAKEKNLIVINNKSSIEFFLHSSPKDFLTWIKNAEIVLTDSFHGTMFSVIFNKNFISDMYNGKLVKKTRIFDVLKEIKLEDRFKKIDMDNYNIILNLLNENIDYNSKNKYIEMFSKKSAKWLLKAIEEK